MEELKAMDESAATPELQLRKQLDACGRRADEVLEARCVAWDLGGFWHVVYLGWGSVDAGLFGSRWVVSHETPPRRHTPYATARTATARCGW